MLFDLLFRFWFALGLRVYAFVHAWMPTNHLLRWVNTDRGIKWGLPIGVALTPLYYLAMTWSGEHLNAGDSAWWWVPTLLAATNTIKFAHVTIRSPTIWAHRTVRRRTEPWLETSRGHESAGRCEPRRRPYGRCVAGK